MTTYERMLKVLEKHNINIICYPEVQSSGFSIPKTFSISFGSELNVTVEKPNADEAIVEALDSFDKLQEIKGNQ